MADTFKRTNFQNELLAKVQNFRLNVSQTEPGVYTAKVEGQDISATANSEAAAVRAVKETAKTMLIKGQLGTLKQKFF